MNKLNKIILNGEFGSTYANSLSKNSYANLFNVVNCGEKSYFNLCKGINFNNVDNIKSSMYNNYMVKDDDCWTNISYIYYHTVDLWWLICKFNGITNPFKMPEPGTIIKIPSDEIKDYVLNIIKSM